MKRKETLEAATKCVCTDREGQYGGPEDTFGKIAFLWTAYLGRDIQPEDVANMMILLKVARLKNGRMDHADSWVDIAGYAACGAEISEKAGCHNAE